MTGAGERPQLDDSAYLRDVQYRDDAKLAARIALHQRFSTNPQGWPAWHFDRIAPQPGERVLEVGCGQGALWVQNAARLQPGVELVLTDFSEGMLAGAEASLREAGVDAAYAIEDVQQLSFEDASFDVVVAAHMLYHVPDRQRALAEIRRVLRPSGRAVVATNGESHLAELDGLLERYGGGSWRQDVGFSLENGAEQLAAVFGSVERQDYADGLRITKGRALVAYLLSMPGAEDLDEMTIETMAREIEALVAEGDGFRVTKSAGAFVCRP